MKLDLFDKQWIDIVFEGRNKAYGAYELRKENSKTTVRALIIGAFIFGLAVSAPLIISLIPDFSQEAENNDIKITTVKLPPKELPKDIPPPPPPPPKVDQVKFVKPVVAKTEEIVEEIIKVEEIKDTKIGKEDIDGSKDAPLTLDEVGKGPTVIEEDDKIYNSAGIEVKPDFPGGMAKFYAYIGRTYQAPEDCGSGKVYVNFVVEKDGSLTDIKVAREVCPGSGKEAVRVLKSSPKWKPGVQNGKPVRVSYALPINIQASE